MFEFLDKTGLSVLVNAITEKLNLKLDKSSVASSISDASTSTDVPTSAAVADYVEGKGYSTTTGTITGIITSSPLSGSGTSGSVAISHASSGATAGSYGDSTAQTPSYGGTFKVPYVTVNATGHVTGISEHTVKIPASDNTDTVYTHPTVTTADTTSTASPSHGGTVTMVDGVTRDTSGHVTGINVKTVTLPADQNTDTKVTQTVTTSAANYPLLLAPTGQTASTTTTSYFGTKFQANPSTGVLTATTFSGALSGNATTATALATGRTIQTNLASSTAATFNGSVNITPGVTGVLPIANGGTGSSTGFVAITTTEIDALFE